MKRIKKNDTIIIIAGRSKNQIGKISRIIGEKVLVEGINFAKKHIKPNSKTNEKGGIMSIEVPLHVSNVALYNPIRKKADRIGFKFIKKNDIKQKVRYFKSNNEIVDSI